MMAVTGWTAVGNPAPAGAESISAHEFVDVLGEQRDRLIPFVGAGLAEEAGAPSGSELVSALLAGADEPALPEADFFATVDRLATERGEEWVQRTVAETVNRSEPRPTSTLTALAKVASRLVITTNYDDAIEVSARAAGIEVVTATVQDFRPALGGPGNALVVMHLHGVASDPASIVLTRDSYERALTDEVMRLLLRSRGVTGRIVFVGQSLAEREAHVRRDVAWSTTAGVPTGEQRHLMVMSVPDIHDEWAGRRAQSFVDDVGLRVFVFHDPERTFQAVRLVATVIAGRSALADEALAESMPVDDRHYVAHAVAPAEHLADATSRGGYLARTWQEGAEMTSDLDAREARLLLVAGGGYGKSRELREVARRADRHALYLRLSGVEQPREGVPSDILFLRWMERATCAQDNPSHALSADSLTDESYVLLLDGLDEVRSDLRPGVVDVINRVVERHPQHRWVVGSRPVPEVEGLSGFVQYTWAPDGDWLQRYAGARGVSAEQVDRFLAGAPGIADLMAVPVFAVSVVDELHDGREPPRTALDLVLALADARVVGDRRPLADPAGLTAWLDRVALAMQLRAVTETETGTLVAGGLHVDLGVAPTPDLVEDLAVRALVTDVGGAVRFPANIVQEARAARSVLSAGERGQDLLRAHVLVRLPVTGPYGIAVAGVRPGWANTLELLLGAADEQWRRLVAEYDPVLAARATPTDAAEPERHRAVATLWGTYVRRQVWLARGHDSTGRDDGGALRRLALAGPPPGFRDVLLMALGADDRTVRANALTVLSALLSIEDLRDHVRLAITDGDPVVRRQAASVAMELRDSDLSNALAAQAAVETDDLARQTLADFAVVLAPSNEHALALAEQAVSVEQADRAWREVTHRVPRQELIGLVEGPPPRGVLLDVLLDDGALHRNPWTPQEVCRLAEVLAVLPDDLRHADGVEKVLASQPLAALAGRLPAPPDELLKFHVGRLAAGWDSDELSRVITLLSGDASACASEAGVSPTDVPCTETVAIAREYLEATAWHAVAPPPNEPTRGSAAERRRVRLLAAAEELRADDVALLLRQTPSALDEVLDRTQQSRLDARTAEELTRLLDGGELDEETTARQKVPLSTLDLFTRAAHRGFPIEPRHWVAVTLSVLRAPDDRLKTWCLQNYDSGLADELSDRLTQEPPAAAAAAHEVVPNPWPDALVRAVLDATVDVASAPDPIAQHRAARTVAALVQGGATDLIRQRLPEPCPAWLLPLAVTLHNCEAERALLEEVLADTGSIWRWPDPPAADWLAALQCKSSADLLEAVLSAALVDGHETNDLRPLFSALDRVEGVDALVRYDRLIADGRIPAAPFLFYERQRALAVLLEDAAQETLQAPDADADAAVLRLTPLSTDGA